MTDDDYWEQRRVLQQAATDAARDAYRPRLQPNTPKDGLMSNDDDLIQAHLDRQADVPDGYVKLDDGRVRPVGGTADNASPRRGDPDYLPDPS